MSKERQILIKKVCCFFVILLALYGLGRLYYQLTDGFLVKNIHYEKNDNPKYDAEVSSDTLAHAKKILKSPFYYLGKGCQSYVFEDATKTYVVKFLKYQRYRPYTLLDNLNFIPWVQDYTKQRREHKCNKIENVYLSWKTALVMAPEETGVLFVHLNKTPLFEQKLTIYDKIGLRHEIDLNEVEFLLQKKAKMLEPYLKGLVKAHQEDAAVAFLRRMLDRTMSEFQRGISDNDYALLQNTGVIDDNAVHIDVGQIIYNPVVKEPTIYRKELFNKTYKFRAWLKSVSPSVAEKFDEMLIEIIGPDFYVMPPYINKSNMGDIHNLSITVH